jgi:integrase
MKNHHAANERIKRRYFVYLAEALGQSQQSIDSVAAAIARFESYTRNRDFKLFHIEQAKGFKKHLSERPSGRSGEHLSKATLYATLSILRRFFHWLAGQPSYKSRISYSDAEYFNLSLKDARVAKTVRLARVPTLEQIRHVIFSMPATTDIERRDRALIAFTILTAARDGAIASLKLKHLDLVAGRVDQDAREVKTKFSKSISTTFFPVGDDIRTVVVAWVNYLRRDLLWGLDDPLFPATKVAVVEGRRFGAVGLDRKHWSNAGRIRAIFKETFASCGLPCFNPHSFRNTIALLGESTCKSPEEFKAWSQNMGHEHVLTTFCSYGNLDPHRQAAIMRSFAGPAADSRG